MDLVKVRDKESGEEFATHKGWVDGDLEIVGGPETLTAEQIAQALASDAENANYHDFVEFFQRLGAITVELAGEAIAAKIMLEVAKGGGYNL
jgi:hypothetical protein